MGNAEYNVCNYEICMSKQRSGGSWDQEHSCVLCLLNEEIDLRVLPFKKKQLIRDAFLRGVVISRQFIVAINVFRFLPNVDLECN